MKKAGKDRHLTTEMSKNIFADKKQLILFLKIGVGYLALSLFGALVSHPDQFLQAYLLNETWMAIYVVAVNYILHVTTTEWLITLILIGLVWMAEVFNTAIEKLADRVTGEHDALIGDAKDMAAGAVLIICGFAVLCALIIYFPYVTG